MIKEFVIKKSKGVMKEKIREHPCRWGRQKGLSEEYVKFKTRYGNESATSGRVPRSAEYHTPHPTKDVHVIIPRTLHGSRHFAHVMKSKARWGDYFGLFSWARSNHRGPQ